VVTQQDIQRAAETIASTASSPATVILFGSHANGTAGQDSDVDFLVVEDQVADQLKEYGRLRRAILWSLDAAVDTHAKNGVRFSQLERQRLRRMRHAGSEETTDEEVSAA
jgi:predicted nucleotidyltransferase